MQVPRRAVLLGAATTVSGCSALSQSSKSTPTPPPDSDGDGTYDPIDAYPENPQLGSLESRTVSEGMTLERGEYDAHHPGFDRREGEASLRYEVDVTSRGNVDCLVLEREAYDAFNDGARDVSIVESMSQLDVRETLVTEPIPAGEYLFVLDYTDLGTPVGSEAVEVALVVEQLTS